MRALFADTLGCLMGVTNILRMFTFRKGVVYSVISGIFPESVRLTEGSYIQSIMFLLLRCSFSLCGCPFAHLMIIKYIPIGVLALLKGVISTWKVFLSPKGWRVQMRSATPQMVFQNPSLASRDTHCEGAGRVFSTVWWVSQTPKGSACQRLSSW